MKEKGEMPHNGIQKSGWMLANAWCDSLRDLRFFIGSDVTEKVALKGLVSKWGADVIWRGAESS